MRAQLVKLVEMDGEIDEAAERLAEIQSDNLALEMENKLLTLHASRVLQVRVRCVCLCPVCGLCPNAQTRAILQATSEEQEETEKAVRKASRKAGKKERLPQELTL